MQPATETAEIDGVIRNATIEPVPGWDDKMWVRGALYDDRKGRFADGELIRTSYIVSGPDADGIVRTRNSVYRVELSAKAVSQ